MVLLGVKFYCKESQYIMIPLPDGTSKEYCQYTEGEQIMEINGFEVYSLLFFYFFIFMYFISFFKNWDNALTYYSRNPGNGLILVF